MTNIEQSNEKRQRSQAITQTEWEQYMAEKILRLIRHELYMDFRYMDVALSALSYQPKEGIDTLGTEGDHLFYSTDHLLRVYPKNPVYLNRCYLHMILHLIFCHPWLQGSRNAADWDLACDIMIEYLIDHMEQTSVQRITGLLRRKVYKRLESVGQALSAAIIYEQIRLWYEFDLAELSKEFYTDTHAFWPRPQPEQAIPVQIPPKWDKLARQTQMQMERQGRNDGDEERLMLKQIRVLQQRRSYRDFLRKFASLRETMQIDPEEFDLSYYTYGLRIYGNMPLIEPMETKETLQVETFVVVIDTSYSTNGELVKKFLQLTADLLLESVELSGKCRIHILQCDDKVRQDDVVTSKEELAQTLQRFTLTEGGSTDFRPAFRYVDQLMQSGQIRHLQGLLYFTDGKGIYPAKRPEYKTAFIFAQDYEEEAVPPWAMRIRIDHEEIMEGK